jgi:hypothetical protein
MRISVIFPPNPMTQLPNFEAGFTELRGRELPNFEAGFTELRGRKVAKLPNFEAGKSP